MKRTGLFLSLAAGFWLMLWLWLRAGQGDVGTLHRLADGSTVQLVAVTYGSQHRVVVGPFWKRFLIRLAPAPITGTTVFPRVQQKRMARAGGGMPGLQIDYRSDTTNALLFWTVQRNPPRASWPNVNRPSLVGSAINEQGEVYETADELRFSFGPDYRIEAWELTAFPRRGRRVTLRLYPPGTPPTAGPAPAEFTVPNPDGGAHPIWAPRRLPETQRSGELTVTLTNLVLEQYLHGHSPNGLIGQVHANFQLSENGKPSDAWQIESLVLSDATGNQRRSLRWHPVTEGGVTIPWMDAVFGAREAAWGVRGTFVRTMNFPVDSLWSFTNVPVDGSPPSLQASMTNRFKGITLTLGKGFFPGRTGMEIEVRLAPPRTDQRIQLVKVVDDRGEVMKHSSPGYSRRTGFEEVALTPQFSVSQADSLHWSVEVPVGAKSLDLTFSVCRARSFEFVVEPTVISY
ncbi:MAG: hypothetical protein ACYDH9_11505 [Limisphaerales bacterium]